MKIAKIFPKTNFRELYSSDTLWGNIIFAFNMLYGENELKSLLQRFIQQNKKPFILSSLFPFEININGKDRTVYYFPRPMLPDLDITPQSPDEMVILKKFKKIKYIDKTTFELFINGTLTNADLFKRFKIWIESDNKLKKVKEQNEIKALEDTIKINKFNYLTGLEYNFNLHNSIDRMSTSTLYLEGKGQLYFESELSLTENFGLFFLFEENENIIEPCLRLLSDIGIGGNRSIGKGAFKFTIENIEISQPENPNSIVLLSLFHPSNDELNLFNEEFKCYYEITNRLGALGKYFDIQFQQKNPVTCFIEGSTFWTSNFVGTILPTAVIKENEYIYSNYLFFGVKAKLR